MALCPAQIVAELTFTTGFGFTVTVDVAVEVHPANVPVIVYAVVTAGVATTGDPTLGEIVVLGDHV